MSISHAWQEDEDDAADDKADNATEEAKNNSADAKPEDSKVAVDEKPAEDSKDASAEGEKHVRERAHQIGYRLILLRLITFSLFSLPTFPFYTRVQDEL